MAEHRILTPLTETQAGDRLVIAGDEAQHAVRVKRCTPGDAVSLLDGRGRTARATIAATRKHARTHEWELELVIEELHEHPRDTPVLEVWSAVPKGGRLEDMVDQLSQVGASVWAPLETSRGISQPSDHKFERLGRIVAESAKQCARPWLLEIHAGGTLAHAASGAVAVMADAGVAAFEPGPLVPAACVRLLVGPEGGWTDHERAQARAAGVIPASFGQHTMRVETAAVVAAAIVLDRLRRSTPLTKGP